MKLSEASALWGKEVSVLEKITGKRVTTLQDGIDAIKCRVEDITSQERLSDENLTVMDRLEVWADAITTLLLADRKHQDYLREETTKHSNAINGMWDRLNQRVLYKNPKHSQDVEGSLGSCFTSLGE